MMNILTLLLLFNSKLNIQIFVKFWKIESPSLTRKTSWNDSRGLRLESS